MTRKTYGASLNDNNDDDKPLMDWLEGLTKYGESSRVVRDALVLKYSIENGEEEICKVGTELALIDANARILELEREIAALRAQPASAPLDMSALSQAIAQGVSQGIAQSGATFAAPAGNGKPASSNEDREDDNDPLVLAMLGLNFQEAFTAD